MIYIGEKRKETGAFFWDGRRRSFLERHALEDFWGEKNRGNGEEQLQPRLSRYASCYS